MRARSILGLVTLTAWTVLAATPAEEHVLSGARAFRDGDWAKALVEFRVALKLGGPAAIHWYEGAALTRVGRFEEAVESFERAMETAPDARDSLLDYYRALACFEAQLLSCALEVATSLEQTAGPRVQEQAAALVREANRVLADEPPRTAIDACFSRARAASSNELARAWMREAQHLAGRRADKYREEEARRAASSPRD